MPKKNIKIVTIGGGSGQYVLLSGLRDVSNFDISAVVSMVDSGSSTGRLRDELGVLPPGDVVKCVLALSSYREKIREVIQKRFKNNSKLNGHSVGNMLLTMLSQYTNSFPEGVKALGEVLDIKGSVLPVTTDKATLVAELTDGSWLFGESAIDIPRGSQREKIKRTFLVPHHTDNVSVYPPVIEKIKKSDYVIIGPGDLYTSIVPNFLISEVKKAIKETSAKIIFVTNIMTKYGETQNFKVSDFIKVLEKFIGREINYILFNKKKPSKKVLESYKKQKAELVLFKNDSLEKNRNIIKEDLLTESESLARHDYKKLSNAINKSIINKNYE